MKRKRKTTFAIVMAAFMAASLPWQADKAFASGALDVPETAVNAETEIAVSEASETGETSPDRGDSEAAEVLRVPEQETEEAEQEESSEEQETTVDAQNQESEPREKEAEVYGDDVIVNVTIGNITLIIDASGKLTMSGSGDLDFDSNTIFKEYYGDIVTSAEVNVTGMTTTADLFSLYPNIKSIDLTGLDTSNVTDMNNMFYGCDKLKSLDLSNFDTSNVTNMEYMFYRCSSLISLDLSNFDTSNVTNMRYMFNGCIDLKSLNLSSFNTRNVTNMKQMFAHCGLIKADLHGFHTSKVTDMSYMFDNCGLTNMDLSSFDTSSVVNMAGMFSRLGVSNLDLSSFNTSNVTDMREMFSGCAASSLDLSGFDTSKVTDMGYMFSGCAASSLDLSGFDTSKVTDMGYMFSGCVASSLDLSGFDTSKVTDMSYMFSGCAVSSLDLSGFDTSKVMDMSSMFSRCSSLKILDLSKFDMHNVIDAEFMIGDCTNLVTINTPFNLTLTVEIPMPFNTYWLLPDGTEITELPQNLNHSIKLSRKSAEALTYEITDYIGGKEVTFRAGTRDAVIYYTDKPNITFSDKKVENGGKVKFEGYDSDTSVWIQARACVNDQWISEPIVVYFDIHKVAPPIISRNGNTVEIKAATEESTIYYTTDGSVPSMTNGKKAGTDVTIDTFSGTVKAIAVKSGYANSQMARKVLLNSTKSRTVSFAVKGVFGGRNVTFNSETRGAKIYYSSTTSTLTTKDKCVNAGDTVLFEDFYGTIYARTYYNGEWGNPCRLILKIPVVNTPTVSVDSKGYATIRTTTPKSRIYYTTNGSTPSMTNGKMVSSPYARVYVGKGKTVKAIAVRSCFTHSKVGTGK